LANGVVVSTLNLRLLATDGKVALRDDDSSGLSLRGVSDGREVARDIVDGDKVCRFLDQPFRATRFGNES
jgi:hypothetical protein